MYIYIIRAVKSNKTLLHSLLSPAKIHTQILRDEASAGQSRWDNPFLVTENKAATSCAPKMDTQHATCQPQSNIDLSGFLICEALGKSLPSPAIQCSTSQLLLLTIFWAGIGTAALFSGKRHAAHGIAASQKHRPRSRGPACCWCPTSRSSLKLRKPPTLPGRPPSPRASGEGNGGSSWSKAKRVFFNTQECNEKQELPLISSHYLPLVGWVALVALFMCPLKNDQILNVYNKHAV